MRSLCPSSLGCGARPGQKQGCCPSAELTSHALADASPVCFRVDVAPRQMLAFGAWLATRGALARAAIGLSALGALASVVVTVVMARRGGSGAEHLPRLVALEESWAAGVTLAFAGAIHALRRDQEEGVVALARARGVGLMGYARGRIAGLAVVVAIAVAVPTLIAALGATSIARSPAHVARSSLGALAYALAFSATIAPLAMAALGARTRAGGYLTLLAVLVLPELLAPFTEALLPSGWDELTSIPAALGALGDGVEAPLARGEHLARAFAGLAAVVLVSVVVVAARLRGGEEGRA